MKELFKKWWFWLIIVIIMILLVISFLPIWGMGCIKIGDITQCAIPRNFWQGVLSGGQTAL
jgi:hypothetical protein